jgi:hypothetical protein
MAGPHDITAAGRRVPEGKWRKFIAAHMDVTVAIDFFICNVLTWHGIFQAYSMVFMHHASRQI